MGLFGDSSTTTDTSDDSTTTATTTTSTKTTTPPVVQAVETSDVSYPKASQIAQVQDECEGQGITSSDCGHAAKDYLGRNVGIAVGVVVGLLILGYGIYRWRRHRNEKKEEKKDEKKRKDDLAFAHASRVGLPLYHS